MTVTSKPETGDGAAHVRGPLLLSTGVDPSQPLWLGDRIIDLLPDQIAAHSPDRTFVVTEEALAPFGRDLVECLHRAGVDSTGVYLAAGEPGKSWSALSSLCERLVAAGCTKSSMVLAVGGGVVSNITGLASSLIYRGVRYVEVPTTLLNLTDGVLSNKQAVNGDVGKNQFGVYYAPTFVWGDVSYLRSEPVAQWRSGITEAAKNGLLNDAAWFARLERLVDPALECLTQDLLGMCTDMIRSKQAILQQDPSERGRSVILEYGHTVGHAVEFLTDGAIPHGQAVGIGMCAAARVGHRLGITSEDVVERQLGLLRRLGSPVDIPAQISVDDVIGVIGTDNKRRSAGAASMIFVEEVGQVYQHHGDVEVVVPLSDLEKALRS